MYFMSKVLTDAETRYTDFQRIMLAFRTTIMKLHPYFEAHTIVVLTNHQIKAILHKLETSGRLLKWAIELSEFDIESPKVSNQR